MSKDANNAFIKALSKVNHSLQSRTSLAEKVASNPEKISHLVQIAFNSGDKMADRAFWILEILYFKDRSLLQEHLETMLNSLNNVQRESSLRPLAKILSEVAATENLTPAQQLGLTEACFTWLIEPRKVATKAHAMSALFELGKENPWIHTELLLTLEHNYAQESAAYQARARRVSSQIKKYRKSADKSV